MMNFCFFGTMALGLTVIQTIVLPGFSWFPLCFDLMIVLVLYLSLAFSHYGTIIAISGIGLIMDSISGVPFFFHFFSYLWIYLFVQLFKQVVFQRSALFMITVSLLAVLVQHGLILFSIFLEEGGVGLLTLDYTRLVWQLVLGGVFIPPGIWGLSLLRQNTAYTLRQVRRELVRRYRD